MEIRGKEYNNWSLFELDGALDLHSIHDLKSLFKHLCNQDKNVLLDFDKVRSVDSSGISCLMFGQKLLSDSGKKLRIAKLSSSVKIIFQITRGYEVFEIYDELSYAAQPGELDQEKAA